MQETDNKAHPAAMDLLPFSPKDRIDHPAFGSGTIVEIDEWRTTIEFDESGIRTFVTRTIKCTSGDTLAPVGESA